MLTLKLYGMRAAYDEVMATGITSGAFLTEQRNAVLVGGTGTGKSHLAMAIGRACIRGGAPAAFTLSSISSIGWRAKLAPAGKVGSPII
jgi:transcriptional regulator with AAA-type ATPase domain